ncbi:MAG: helix-turn-helix transcriptional regulator [Alphaproteobacteria bacterium]|jgi:phage repressor protein C with HTH and peptisase S24 domain
MLSHRQIWEGIDALAAAHGFSPSGLARRAGLDPTIFNRSKRSQDGKQRWPSTESLSRVLAVTGASIADFALLISPVTDIAARNSRPIPVIGFAQAGTQGFFDDGGFPVGGGWDTVNFPGLGDENAYALEISGDSMLPVYRDGDIVVVSPHADVRRGDRVIAKTLNGEVMAKQLLRKTASRVELASFNPEFPLRTFSPGELSWIARIIWASQ